MLSVGKNINLEARMVALQWLAKANVKPTKQRIKIAEYLVGNGEHKHITAEQLFELCDAGDTKISLATVYNTLHCFCSAGLLSEVIVDANKKFFCTRVDDHPHFYWESTGELTDAKIDNFEIKNLPCAPKGSKISKVDIIIRLSKEIE